jgi:hypothetical protein
MVRMKQKKNVYRKFDSRHLTIWAKVISKNLKEVECSGIVKFLRPWASNNNGHPNKN